MESQAQKRIREFIINNIIKPVKERGEKEIVIRAGDIAKAMRLENRIPNICQVLRGKKLQEEARIKLIEERGPKQSTTTIFVFHIEYKENNIESKRKINQINLEKINSKQFNKIKVNDLIEDFKKVAKLAGVNIPEGSILVEELIAPHSPPTSLPSGKMAVYVFFWNDKCLKVGKVGPRSQARYTSHHYNPNSSQSNLARSILQHKEKLGLEEIDESTIGDWIKRNLTRINFILDEELGIPVLSLMEVFFQCRLRPMFEGFESQK